MSTKRIACSLFLTATLAAGCSGGSSAGVDASPTDAPAAPDATGVDGPVADAGPADAGVDPDAGPARLPPWLSYCDTSSCATDPAVIYVCPAAAPTCTPSRHTTVIPRVDGRTISGVFFPVVAAEGLSLRVESGGAAVLAHLVTAYAPAIELHSDLDVTVSYYAVAPVWGGDTHLDFTSSSRTSATLDSVFFAHPSYDTGTAAADLHAQGQTAIADERTITGLTSEHVHGLFLPSELAGASGGEGNFSYGDGTVTTNYGNPDYIAAMGGIIPTVFPRFAHEFAHELFDELTPPFAGNPSCLNEGVADALAFVSGHLPEADFGPIGLRGANFDDGCAALDEIHDIGNCYFWHVRNAGLLDDSFMNGVFHPQHTFTFDSCNQNALETGNSILVLFTEAASGADMMSVLDAMGIPHAASYEDANTALGF